MGAFPGTHVHTADNQVPPLDDEHAGLDADLAGVHPGIDLIRDGLRLISTDRLTRDDTQTLIATLMGSADGTDIHGLLTATTARLMRADTNPALRDLAPDIRHNLDRIAEGLTYDTASYAPRDYPAEACFLIDPYADRT